jgi:hypothetical protein
MTSDTRDTVITFARLTTLLVAVYFVFNPVSTQAVDCHSGKAIYLERWQGFSIEVSRIGDTQRDYTRSGNQISGIVLDIVGPDKKRWYLEGPFPSNMFFAESSNEGVRWRDHLTDLPPSLRLKEGGKQTALFEIDFLTCAEH